ncbi:hypothetical protein Ancab_029431 [Ancistrocladus abbreviatus]
MELDYVRTYSAVGIKHQLKQCNDKLYDLMIKEEDMWKQRSRTPKLLVREQLKKSTAIRAAQQTTEVQKSLEKSRDCKRERESRQRCFNRFSYCCDNHKHFNLPPFPSY